jgi:hypothetical protein
MKKTILTLVLAFVSIFAIGQTMTISHTGISTVPSSTDKSLSVNVGDDITFIYGGGGSHPMTEGWQDGSASTPVSFVTQTVTSSIPTVTFQINTAGIYKFHCGTSPGNSNNWGTIYVADGTTSAATVYNNPISVFPNPARNILTVKGLTESAAIYRLNGNKVMYVINGTFNVSDLAKGTYIVKTAKYNTIFIKK